MMSRHGRLRPNRVIGRLGLYWQVVGGEPTPIVLKPLTGSLLVVGYGITASCGGGMAGWVGGARDRGRIDRILLVSLPALIASRRLRGPGRLL